MYNPALPGRHGARCITNMGRFLTSLTYILVFCWFFSVAYAQDNEIDITLTRYLVRLPYPRRLERKIFPRSLEKLCRCNSLRCLHTENNNRGCFRAFLLAEGRLGSGFSWSARQEGRALWWTGKAERSTADHAVGADRGRVPTTYVVHTLQT